MKLKLKWKRSMSLALCMAISGSVFTAAGCRGTDETSSDPLTINVKMIDGGYGSAWIEEIKEKFEALYKDDGYKVNVMTPVEGYSGAQALSEMRNNVNGIDLFVTEGVDVDDVLDEDYGVCAVNLNDVYNSKAINFDGTESEQTIKATSEGIHEYVKSGNDFYAYYWYKSPSALVVNTSLLAEYSEITDLPRTTDELFEMYDTATRFGLPNTVLQCWEWAVKWRFVFPKKSFYLCAKGIRNVVTTPRGIIFTSNSYTRFMNICRTRHCPSA